MQGRLTGRRLLYPARCPVCDRVTGAGAISVCGICRSLGKPEEIREPVCRKCGKPLDDGEKEFCMDCGRRPPAYTQGCAAFAYRGMEDSIDRWKNRNRRCYTGFFAAELVRLRGGQILRWKPQVIVPVPVHSRRRRERGYNQAELLGAELSERLGIPMDPGLLCRVRDTRAQKELGDGARRGNIRGAFQAARQAGQYGRILLVDDIYTTGSTAQEASRTLLEAGAGEVFCACLCIGRGY